MPAVPSARGMPPRRRAVLGPLGRLVRSRAGNVAVEFALVVPVILMLMLGSVELARFVTLNQKLERVAVSMSDLVARAETISQSELDDIFVAAGEVAQPFDLAGAGLVIISSLQNADGNGAMVAWQRSGGGSLSASSKIGSPGGSATLPEGFEVRQGETAIVAEVLFAFEPFLSELIVAPQTLYKSAHHRPRLGTLETIEDG